MIHIPKHNPERYLSLFSALLKDQGISPRIVLKLPIATTAAAKPHNN